ncbi:hypothetical protein OTU49_008024 [Cherax quadricarinatus]|uniref:WD repeat-containing protein 86 n=2 Tax=Cherax quadricarinatus TaxID=27406 RepID=A0AAW0YAZ1_CHEQU
MGSGLTKEGLEASPLTTITEHQGGINCMALSEDSSLLVSGSDDRTVHMWSTKSEPIENLGVLNGHTGFIQCATVYDTYVITGSKDTTIKKWDMATAACEYTYTGHTGRVNRVICSGEFLFSTSHDKTARAWLFHTHDVHDPSQACIRVFEGHTGVVSAVIFVPGQDTGVPDDNGFNINPSDILITASFDNTARVWSFDTAQCLKVVEDAHDGAILYLRVVNRLMYTTGTDNYAKCWARDGLENTRTYKDHTDSVTAARFHNGVLYTVCNDGIVRAFDAKSGSLKRKFLGHKNAVTCLAVCVNQQEDQVYTRLVTGDNNGILIVWNATGISSEVPMVTMDQEYQCKQNQRLEELNQHLDDYVADDPLTKSSTTSLGGGMNTDEIDNLGIIDDD